MGDRLVLGYHAVSDRWPSTLAVTPQRLEEQLRFLTSRGYRPGTFSEVLARPDDGLHVAVTFDDGYRSVFERAFPILQRLGVPATVFVPTALVGADAPMSWPGIDGWAAGPYASELLGMSWDQLRELAGAGWEIGSHTRSHPRLTELDGEALARELRGSRTDCERRVAMPCRALAYPYGAVDARVVRAAREAGYLAAAGRHRGVPGERSLQWPRVGVYPVDDLRRFRLKVSPALRALRSAPGWEPIASLGRRVETRLRRAP